MSIESVMPSNHLILCCPLLLLSSIFPSIRVFSKQSVLCIMWPNYWNSIFSVSPSNEYSGLVSFRIDWLISLLSEGLSRVFSNTTVQKPQYLAELTYQCIINNIPFASFYVFQSLLVSPHYSKSSTFIICLALRCSKKLSQYLHWVGSSWTPGKALFILPVSWRWCKWG